MARDYLNEPHDAPVRAERRAKHESETEALMEIVGAKDRIKELERKLEIARGALEHIAGDAPCGDPLEPDCCDQCAARATLDQLDQLPQAQTEETGSGEPDSARTAGLKGEAEAPNGREPMTSPCPQRTGLADPTSSPESCPVLGSGGEDFNHDGIGGEHFDPERWRIRISAAMSPMWVDFIIKHFEKAHAALEKSREEIELLQKEIANDDGEYDKLEREELKALARAEEAEQAEAAITIQLNDAREQRDKAEQELKDCYTLIPAPMVSLKDYVVDLRKELAEARELMGDRYSLPRFPGVIFPCKDSTRAAQNLWDNCGAAEKECDQLRDENEKLRKSIRGVLEMAENESEEGVIEHSLIRQIDSNLRAALDSEGGK